MTRLRDLVPATWLPSLLAALTTWVTLLAWTRFAEFPAGFMVPLVLACLLVAGTGMALRAARVPTLLVLLGQVTVVGFWLHHRFAADAAWGGLVPTDASVRMAIDTVRQATEASQAYAAPVPVSVPEFYPLLILAGAATAILVDLLAVGLRRAPLAGLPLLAAYTAPVSILDGGVSSVKFAAAALCFLFLIAAQEDRRLAHWGHHLTPRAGAFDSRSAVVGGSTLWSSAGTIGLTATAFAVTLPFLVPTFSATLFNGGGGGRGDGPGDSVNINNPMVDLRRDLDRGADVPLLRVTTTDPDPSYLRISVLDSFDGDAWRPSGRDIPTTQRADGDVAAPPGLQSDVARRSFKATISANDYFQSRWLPTPYPVTAVDAPGDWRFDKSTMDFISAADNQTTSGLTYDLTSLRVSPTARQLANALAAPLSVFTPNTALPRSFPSTVRKLAEGVVAGKASKFEQAVALQQWFREDGGFTYSLKRDDGNSTDDLVAFLTKGRGGRVGYCEQFAAAMAVMGRSLGIPSRVAVGFLHPDRVTNRTWEYSTHDLHAWPEMYFEGVGWVRFEPTPSSRTGDVPDYTAQRLPAAAPSDSASAPSAAPSVNRVDKTTNGQTATANSGTGGSGGAWALVAWLGLPLLVVLGLLSPWAARILVRRRRWAAAGDPAAWAEAGWLELRDTSLDLGNGWDARVSVRTAARALEESFGDADEPDDALGRSPRRGPAAAPEASRAVQRIVVLLERARYSRSLPDGATTAADVAADVDTCVAALRAGAGRRRRRRATWLPASLVTAPRRPRRAGTGRGPLLGDAGVDRAV